MSGGGREGGRELVCGRKRGAACEFSLPLLTHGAHGSGSASGETESDLPHTPHPNGPDDWLLAARIIAREGRPWEIGTAERGCRPVGPCTKYKGRGPPAALGGRDEKLQKDSAAYLCVQLEHQVLQVYHQNDNYYSVTVV